MHDSSLVRTAAALCLFVVPPLVAQCQLEWLPGKPQRGTSGNPYQEHVYALHRWDPDGAGPASPRLVFGGPFPTIGPIVANRIASWDPATGEWGTFGTGLNFSPQAFATAANGDLIAAGSGVRRWNGATWSTVGPAFNSSVNDLAVLPNGDVLAVGSFTVVGTSTTVNRVARWNGANWSPLGSGSASPVRAVFALPNGDVVVGGEFTTIGGVAANGIARWDGVAWHALGVGLGGAANPQSTTGVFDLTLLPNGDVVAAGNFATAGGLAAPGVAAWNGSSWSPLGAGLPNGAYGLEVEASGSLLAIGAVVPGAPIVSRWNGTSWQSAAAAVLGGGIVRSLPSGDFVLAGQFQVGDPNGATLIDVARWNGTAWVDLDSATTPWFTVSLGASVHAVAATSDGTLYATGLFQIVDGALMHGIAQRNGTGWSPVGSPLGIGSWPFPYPYPLAMIATKNDQLVVAGRITNIAGGPAAHVVRWNGTAWDNLGGGLGPNGSAGALAELPNGDLVVGGDFTSATGGPGNFVARWDGAAWQPLGAGTDAPVTSLLAMPDGSVIAGGSFTQAGNAPANRVARWDGVAWSPLGAGLGQAVTRLRLLPNGDVVALVAAEPPSSQWTVQRWSGLGWTPLGAPIQASSLNDLVVLPDGDLLVSGYQYSGFTLRWNGTAWSNAPTTDHAFVAHTWLPDGDLVVAGGFGAAGPWLSPYVARLRSRCAATATVQGAGCVGSGGVNQLRATNLPWLGATFRAEGTGLPTLSLVSKVWGFSPTNLPLALVLPQAPAGCDLLVTPDYFEFALTTNGTIETAVVLPDSPALVGLPLYHQLNLFEVDPSLNLIEVTASNALLLTTGVF